MSPEKPPTDDRRALRGLEPKDYQHPFDRKALKALEGTPGLEALTKKLWEYGWDRLNQVKHVGSYLKVTERNFPDLYTLYLDVCKTLCVKKEPDLFLAWYYGIDAYATGVEKPMVVLYSGCLDLLTEDELRFIIGHELGHVISGHLLYHAMGDILEDIGAFIGQLTLGIGKAVSQGLTLALLYWRRMSEFSSDRMGLLACQDPIVAKRCTLKMAGLPIKYFDSEVEAEFLRQAQEFKDFDFDGLNRLMKIYSVMGKTHPWTVMRAAELNNWVESGDYRRLLDRRGSRVKREGKSGISVTVKGKKDE